ncbi:barstar family protein [Nocardia beijingensis]|nr:barstar family protein [Nocardia beijingensis]
MRVTIDGARIRTDADLHRALWAPLDFGPYYGRNLNALWDRLTTDVERPVEIVWKNSGTSRTDGRRIFRSDRFRADQSRRAGRVEFGGQKAHSAFRLTGGGVGVRDSKTRPAQR